MDGLMNATARFCVSRGVPCVYKIHPDLRTGIFKFFYHICFFVLYQDQTLPRLADGSRAIQSATTHRQPTDESDPTYPTLHSFDLSTLQPFDPAAPLEWAEQIEIIGQLEREARAAGGGGKPTLVYRSEMSINLLTKYSRFTVTLNGNEVRQVLLCQAKPSTRVKSKLIEFSEGGPGPDHPTLRAVHDQPTQVVR